MFIVKCNFVYNNMHWLNCMWKTAWGCLFPGIRPPAYPKGSPFLLFWGIHIWLRTLWSLAPKKLILRRAKKTRFFGETFPKNALKKAVFGLLHQKFACGAQNLSKTGSFKCFGRARKISSVGLKKAWFFLCFHAE